MNAYQFFGAALLSFLGLFAGAFISFNVQEELKQGRKYFIVGQALLFAIIFYVMLMLNSVSLYVSIPLSIIIFFIMYYLRILGSLLYCFFGFAFAHSVKISTNAAIAIGSLIFLAGLFTASADTANFILDKERKKKDKTVLLMHWIVFKRYFYFFIGAIVGYLSWVM